MRSLVVCRVCKESVWIRVAETSGSGVFLSDNDWHWDEACDHIKQGGDYDIEDCSYDDDGW